MCLSDGADLGRKVDISVQRCRGVDNSEHLYLERLFPVNYFGLVHVNAQADGKHGGGVSDGGHKLGTRGKSVNGHKL